MVVAELLGRVLTGSSAYAEDGRGGDVYGKSGTLVLALDPGLFRDRADYAREADATLRTIKAIPPGPGFEEVLLPGEPERQARAQRARAGIPIEEATLDAIRDTARSLGLPEDTL
jgi:uncharacterized oxidoreductase